MESGYKNNKNKINEIYGDQIYEVQAPEIEINAIYVHHFQYVIFIFIAINKNMLSQPAHKTQSPTKPHFLIKIKNNNKRYMRLDQINPSIRYKLPFVSSVNTQEHAHNISSGQINISGPRSKTEGIERVPLSEDQIYSLRQSSDMLSNVQNSSEDRDKACKIRIKKQLRIKKLDFIQKNIFKNFESCNLNSFDHDDIKIQKRGKLAENQFLPPISSSRINIITKQPSVPNQTRMVQCMDGMITFSPKKKHTLNSQSIHNSLNNIISSSNVQQNTNQIIYNNVGIRLEN